MAKQKIDDIKMKWLHALTLAGYNDRRMIPKEDLKIVEGYYLEGKTPDEAWAAYKISGRSQPLGEQQ